MNFHDLNDQWKRFYDEKLAEFKAQGGGDPTAAQRAHAIEYADARIDMAGVKELKFEPATTHVALKESRDKHTVKVKSVLP